MDYGKYRYEQEQKAKLARKHQSQIHVKEIKLRPKIGIHDYETKKGHVVRFLNQRAKVKVTIMFRGRETPASGAGPDLLMRLAEDVKELGQIEAPAGARRTEHGHGARADEERRSEAPDAKAEDESGAKKRFKVTGTGKLLRRHAMQSHNLEKKSREAQARLRARRSRRTRATSASRQEAAGERVSRCRASSDRSTRARSAARSSGRPRATGA